LLVAVILITTVIVTYSTIRNNPIPDPPQVLSAIDETNLALKQILGFTVGYYGSVLQVTGNRTYAKELAIEYLHSGLENIGNMHPEWGTSFIITTSELSTSWFTNTSYSMGDLAVKYNLTGLGVSGISYSTSCRLKVQILQTTSSTQTRLEVTKDDSEEPVINLGKQNFRFYRYVYENSTWELVSPSTELTAFANGTYIIDAPQDVNSYSYMVQVEDPRGIVVVASSFSRYTCTLSWNLQSPIKYAVVGTSNIIGAPDGNYAVIGKGSTCEVSKYQGGNGIIKKVYFNITYYGTVSGTLAWARQLDGGAWTLISNLPEGGNATSPLKVTYNATSLRASWTWSNLNTTSIQFQNNDDAGPEDAYVDAIYVTVEFENPGDYSTIPNERLVVELLQNGTMRWLGQHMQMTTNTMPIPPLPVKGIHVNQTINGVNQEVPFQIEDWASNYMIPLGLANNASVFNNRNMIVFLANSRVSKVTIWWNGSDVTNQTSYAYTNRYFTGDNPSAGTLTNGILRLQFGGGFTITATVGSATSTVKFMRINNEWSTYGADPAYVIHHGIVRDIVHQEAEWSGGAGTGNDCPNLYAHIVLALPANVTYFTYQLRLMFVQSAQTRTIRDLCPIRVTASTGSPQTENGTTSGFPIVVNGTGTFYNYSTSAWAHHWSQMISGARGSGLMFTDTANGKLYTFDTIAGTKTGALRIYSSNRTMHLLPVTLAQAQFQFALDVTWYGAVVTFDNTMPIYKVESGKKTGLWIIVEYPPIVSIATES